VKEERITTNPLIPPRLRVVSVCALCVAAALAVWLTLEYPSFVWMVAFIVLTMIGIFVVMRIRSCPACGGRLQVRFEDVEGTNDHRNFLDCPRCQISWTDGKIHHDDL